MVARASAAAAAADRSEAPLQSSKLARSPTAFEKRLYAVCKAIPKGKVATYGILAAVTHSSPRAVGQALRRNPFAPDVPCHRVVASTLELGGFKGDWGDCANVHSKKQMLEDEGVRFDNNRIAGHKFVVAASLLSAT